MPVARDSDDDDEEDEAEEDEEDELEEGDSEFSRPFDEAATPDAVVSVSGSEVKFVLLLLLNVYGEADDEAFVEYGDDR